MKVSSIMAGKGGDKRDLVETLGPVHQGREGRWWERLWKEELVIVASSHPQGWGKQTTRNDARLSASGPATQHPIFSSDISPP